MAQFSILLNSISKPSTEVTTDVPLQYLMAKYFTDLQRKISSLSAIPSSKCQNWSFKRQIGIFDPPVDSKFPSDKK